VSSEFGSGGGVRPASFKYASNEGEVVDMVRQCLASLQAHELGRLPESCRPGEILRSEDITNLAFSITSARIAGNGVDGVLQKLDTLFAHACLRLTELATDPRPAHSR
jgi:hypothetical protein